MITIDTSKFNAVLAEYMARCPQTLETILNKKMYFILRGAWQATPRVDRSRIEHELGIEAYKVRKSRKTGKFSRGAAVHAKGAIVFAIVNARRRRKGLKGLQGKELDKAVRRLQAARFRGAGILKRGFLRSLLAFSAKARESMVAANDGRMPAGKGQPRPAEAGWNPIASTTYEVNIDSRGNAHIDPRVERATAAAFEAELASMQTYIERKIQEQIEREGLN